MKKGFLARRVEEVRRGPSGFDLEEFAKRPKEYLRERKGTRGVPKPYQATRESTLYAEFQGAPSGLRDPVRSQSLTEGSIGRAERPSPPNSLPPTRRRLGPNAPHSASSADDVFGSACDLPQHQDVPRPAPDLPQHPDVLQPAPDLPQYSAQPQQLYLDMSVTRVRKW